MKNRKSIIIAIIVSLFLGLIVWFGWNFAPGSYPYAEEYTIDVPEAKLIEVLTQFKENAPEFKVPRVTIDKTIYFDLKDERVGKEGYWYKIYFYYPKENRILYTLVRANDLSKTTFSFVSINNGLSLGNWKDINKDFSRSENRVEIKKFEERILNKIKAILKEE